MAEGCCVKVRTQRHTATHLFKLFFGFQSTVDKPTFSLSHTNPHVYILGSGQEWTCSRSEKGVLVPNVSLSPESLCSGTDNQRETFSHPFHLPALKCCIPVRVTHSCQVFKPFLLRFFPLTALCLCRSNEKNAPHAKIRETALVLLMSSTQLHENSITEPPPPSPSACHRQGQAEPGSGI